MFAPEGTPVVSPTATEVLETGTDGGRGNWAALYDAAAKHTYVYMHMSAPASVAAGDRLEPGDQVGLLGCTGSCDGASPALRDPRGQEPLRARRSTRCPSCSAGSRRSRPARAARSRIRCPMIDPVDLVIYETRGSTAILTINRPERRNAVDTATAGELLAGLRRFEADDEARVMVLTGAGDQAFCAGADLKALAEAGPDLPERDRRAGRRPARGPDGLHAADGGEAGDRGDRRLVPGRRPRAGALVRSADRGRGSRSSATRSAAGACR